MHGKTTQQTMEFRGYKRTGEHHLVKNQWQDRAETGLEKKLMQNYEHIEFSTMGTSMLRRKTTLKA